MMYHYDSRFIKPGDTFICLNGGEPYIEKALENGAVDVLKMTRAEMANLAAEYYGNPSEHLQVVGVTGTNGKTTVTHFVNQALTHLGYKSAVLGTLNASLTTPESLDIQRIMADHVKAGGTHFVMEVSSHAITQHRIKNIAFDIKCLTNLTQDHLDYHQTLKAYHETKLSFMETYPGKKIMPEDFLSQELPFQNPFYVGFHKENLQAAWVILRALNIPEDQAGMALKTVKPPEGRFESIQAESGMKVIIDYAHTPDGLEKVAIEAKKWAAEQHGEAWMVFGCGGERDRGKRPLMGEIASRLADHVIITSDNPRSESQDDIVAQIQDGIPEKDKSKVKIIHDRREAIKTALREAKGNDVLVIAGKGHEKVQILKEGTVPFHDKSVVLEILEGHT